MENGIRRHIGGVLLDATCELQGESGVDEDTVRDAICDILHAAIGRGYLQKNDEDISSMLACCTDNVFEELKEESE